MRALALSLLISLASLASLASKDARAEDKDDGLRETVVAHSLEVKLKAQPNVAYDRSRLGHVVLATRVTITNRGASLVPLDPKGLKVSARGALASYPCEARGPNERWPESLGPGEVLSIERVVVCDTTLPGAHDLDVRWASSADADAAIATTPFVIEPGATPPLRLVSRPELAVTVTGSHEVRPSAEPGKVRIVLGVVNASPMVTSLSALSVTITLRQRGRTFSCQDRRTVDLRGMLGAGKMHVVWLPLGCAVPYEGDWETTVEVGEPNTPSVRLHSHIVRVKSLPDQMQQTPPR